MSIWILLGAEFYGTPDLKVANIIVTLHKAGCVKKVPHRSWLHGVRIIVVVGSYLLKLSLLSPYRESPFKLLLW